MLKAIPFHLNEGLTQTAAYTPVPAHGGFYKSRLMGTSHSCSLTYHPWPPSHPVSTQEMQQDLLSLKLFTTGEISIAYIDGVLL
jgi:hypothetical protein